MADRRDPGRRGTGRGHERAARVGRGSRPLLVRRHPGGDLGVRAEAEFVCRGRAGPRPGRHAQPL